MLVLFSWIGGIFLVILTGLLGYRAIVRFQLKQLAVDDVASVPAKKKLMYIKQRENEKHIHYLIFWGLGMTFFLFCLFYYTLTIQQKNTEITQQLTRASEELMTLKTEQKIFIQQTPLLEYPEKGLGLANEGWETLVKEKDNRKLQGEMEQTLSQKIAPYIGLSTVLITVEAATDTIYLSIQNEERGGIEMDKLVTKMLDELTAVKELKEVTFQTVLRADGKTQETEQWQYTRTGTEDFQLVSGKENDEEN
ncbi:hypothetical protein BAU15_03480 [Enterococcus sp. JM4C]|uniref:hypothetical protein n=1 Tax=Candidatus Enterococcus huntleyi TaxID=1857217 RepID=UPI0013796A1C|nr:hypothetical protein [Enterococcus sp. JM4C]KAF1295614.1 hypothetical protein BAU15_03480 [Enterococcus sp. JM4C]